MRCTSLSRNSNWISLATWCAHSTRYATTITLRIPILPSDRRNPRNSSFIMGPQALCDAIQGFAWGFNRIAYCGCGHDFQLRYLLWQNLRAFQILRSSLTFWLFVMPPCDQSKFSDAGWKYSAPLILRSSPGFSSRQATITLSSGAKWITNRSFFHHW